MFLITQTFFHPENKTAFYAQALRADSLHSYDVLSYEIRLNLPMTSRYLSGAVKISARSNLDNLNTVVLQLLGLSVDSLKVEDTPATYSHVGESLHVNLPYTYSLGDTFDILVGYSGTPSGELGYLWYPGTNPTNRTISYSLGCPYDTKRWMPCYDPMWDKADYGVEFYITVPDSFTVCANGEFLDKQVAGGYATYHWKHEYPIYNIDWQKTYEAPNWRLILDVIQSQTIGPAVFHIPLPIKVQFTSGDTMLSLAIDDSIEHFEYVLSQEPNTIVVDPEIWVLQKNYITGVFEESPEHELASEKISTIGRAIEIKLNEPSLIKIFDITGRKIYESKTKDLNYQPSSAGIYQVIIGDKKQRVVIVK